MFGAQMARFVSYLKEMTLFIKQQHLLQLLASYIYGIHQKILSGTDKGIKRMKGVAAENVDNFMHKYKRSRL